MGETIAWMDNKKTELRNVRVKKKRRNVNYSFGRLTKNDARYLQKTCFTQSENGANGVLIPNSTP
ncbi:hypothetical protein [Leptospira stimsonii]|uniref:Uncharacterized protein n=1 Tax=Leptospira stimsonii TaxID=2202203 RepID=A0A396Z678_9LEPT|nr:hypothetical protein [Leptospira stimsonii]RHX89623.1 hypothetical protein DLM75_11670 [Leptospira stimsonii]